MLVKKLKNFFVWMAPLGENAALKADETFDRNLIATEEVEVLA